MCACPLVFLERVMEHGGVYPELNRTAVTEARSPRHVGGGGSRRDGGGDGRDSLSHFVSEWGG